MGCVGIFSSGAVLLLPLSQHSKTKSAKMLLQQWWGIAALIFAASDVLYFGSAWSFVAMWGESPLALPLFLGLLRRLLQYSIILLLLLLLLQQEDGKERHAATVIIPYALVIITVLAAVWGWCETRQTIVQGGTYTPPPPSAAADPGDTSNNDSSNKQEPRVLVVTGANTGCGFETVKQLAAVVSQDSTILLLCRSVSKGEEAIQEILASSRIRCCHLQVVACDLSSLQSVRQAAAEIVRQHAKIHTLVNNAGVMLRDLTYTVDGHETCLQANHLGHFLLTALLWPRLVAAADEDARIINVTSSTYKLAVPTFDADRLDDLQCKEQGDVKEEPQPEKEQGGKSSAAAARHRFSLFGQYAATKWCNILFTVALVERQQTATGSNSNVVRCYAVHPGLVRTNVVRNMPWYLYVPNTVFAGVLALLQKTPAQGAWCTVFCATTTTRTAIDATNGRYWVNRAPQELVLEDPDRVREQANKLWQWSCRQVDLSDRELQPYSSPIEDKTKKAKSH